MLQGCISNNALCINIIVFNPQGTYMWSRRLQSRWKGDKSASVIKSKVRELLAFCFLFLANVQSLVSKWFLPNFFITGDAATLAMCPVEEWKLLKVGAFQLIHKCLDVVLSFLFWAHWHICLEIKLCLNAQIYVEVGRNSYLGPLCIWSSKVSF